MSSPRYYLEVPEGLEAVAEVELLRLGLKGLERVPGGFRVSGRAVPGRVKRARTLHAAYLSLTFFVPRPRALLGDANFRTLVTAAKEALRGGRFRGLRLSAAGADSPTLTRLAGDLAGALGLERDQAEGEFLVRLRPDPVAAGWEVLIRLTPRPASTRAWRVCHRPGGVNAAVAAAMNELTRVREGDAYLNLMAGSGTLLVERALAGPARRLVGFDRDPAAVECAKENAAAAGVLERCEWLVGDVADERFLATLAASPEDRFDALTADAPWGDAVGAHAANRELYPKLLSGAAALARPGARFCLLSHEVRLSRRVVEEQRAWEPTRELQVAHGGHHPLVLLLTRAEN